MQQFIVLSPALEKPEALFVSSLLEEAIKPAALAVSVNCVDEASDLWVVTGYYETQPSDKDFDPLLCDTDISANDLTIAPLQQRNWIEESLKGLSPVKAGRFFVHGAHDRHQRPQTTINLEIDAGTAFGTGHHGTTAGCLKALDDLAKTTSFKRILDVGCGTGILALAAARLLKSPILASDIDPEAVKVTAANARANNLGPLIRPLCATGVDHREIALGAPYDLIFANILAGPLVALAPRIAPLVAQNGFVILSGLTLDQERWVLASWRNQNMTPVRKIHMENWSTLVLKPAGNATKVGPKKARPTVMNKARAGQYFIARWLGRRFSY